MQCHRHQLIVVLSLRQSTTSRQRDITSCYVGRLKCNVILINSLLFFHSANQRPVDTHTSPVATSVSTEVQCRPHRLIAVLLLRQSTTSRQTDITSCYVGRLKCNVIVIHSLLFFHSVNQRPVDRQTSRVATSVDRSAMSSSSTHCCSFTPSINDQ